jgi:multimeric flavodoxin WrbA
MRVVISDVVDFPSRVNDRLICLDGDKEIHHCVGCFGCWVKTPGRCVIRDGYENMGELLGRCTELVIVSECVYGSFSPFVKNVLDRSIPYISPYFVMRNKEMHHKQRYKNVINISVYFYGMNITGNEKTTAADIVAANAVNFYTTVKEIAFYNSADEIMGVLA